MSVEKDWKCCIASVSGVQDADSPEPPCAQGGQAEVVLRISFLSGCKECHYWMKGHLIPPLDQSSMQWPGADGRSEGRHHVVPLVVSAGHGQAADAAPTALGKLDNPPRPADSPREGVLELLGSICVGNVVFNLNDKS